MDIVSVAEMALVMRQQAFGQDMALRMLKQASVQEATALKLVSAAAQGQDISTSTAALNTGITGQVVNISV
jgi:hypothetical protein